ncbi:MAG: ABC transporter ATP-binding protein [Rhodospirillales bacterium]
MSYQVAIERVTKRFAAENGREVTALRAVDLDIAPGRFFVLVGDSGSGKTTLMRTVAGLERPDEGEIRIDGRTVFSAATGVFVPPQARGIGMVFQSYAIWPHLTVADNVALPLRHGRRRMSVAECARKVSEALAIVGLSDHADRPAPNLSGGQQQRVALARAIAVSTDLLLMDEPMSNLDARLREDVRNQIKEVVRHYGTTVIYVTHDQVEAMALADEMALMRGGELLQRGTPDALYDRSVSREVAEFFGPMSFLPGEIVQPGSVRTPLGTLAADTAGIAAREVIVGLRPERARIVPGEAGGNRVAATVGERTYLGGTNVYQLDMQGHALRLDAVDPLPVGAAVTVELPAAALRVFPAGS